MEQRKCPRPDWASDLFRCNSNVSVGEVLLMIYDVRTVGGFDECMIANALNETN